MQIWTTLVLALQLLSALVMIGLVLIQHGKGADMGASFGSGSSGSSKSPPGTRRPSCRAAASRRALAPAEGLCPHCLSSIESIQGTPQIAYSKSPPAA